MPVDPERVQAVFLAAAEQESPAVRAAVLDRQCGCDAELRQRVQTLLKAHEAPGPFLEARAPTLGVTADEPVSERLGMVIGPYKLLERIGEGGFGVVFLAEQTQPVRRKVALKVIKPGMDTRQVVARFEAERQALALMDHPNIAHVFDGGETAAGRPYFVMELVKGVPITDFCDQNHLPVPERLGLFVSVCQAVQHAHTKGVIHRDIKPSNVLVTLHDGVPVVKVIDFGVAKAMGQQLTDKTLFTGYSQMIGTPLYMSPEQAGLSGLDIDTRTDVYALGVLLYELLTGTTPFDQERLRAAGYDEIRRMIREGEPARPSARISTLGQAAATISANRQSDPKRLRQLFRGELDWIVMKALEKDRNRRYETASAFAQDVQRYLHDEPVLACPPSLWYRLRKLVRRHKALVAMAGLMGCVLVLLLVVGIGVLVNGAMRGERDLARANEQRAEEAEQRALAAEREINIRAHRARAEGFRRSGQVGQRTRTLAEVAGALQLNPSPELHQELRTEAAAALVLPDAEPVQEWEGRPDDSVGVAFDAAFQRYARLDKQGGVTVCRLSDGREEVITRLPAHGKPPFGSPWMSPDGRFVAYGHSIVRTTVFGGIRVWKLDGPEPVVLLDEPAGMNEAALAFHPSGRQLAIGHADKTVSVYDLATGQRVQRLAVSSAPVHLAFHPRDGRLAVACGNAVQLIDADTGKELPALRHPATVKYTVTVAWHPDGRRLAAGCNDRKIHLWDTETATEVMPSWTGHTVDGMRVAFNHAGDRLVSLDWGRQTRLWDAATGRMLLTMPGAFGLQFSPDDRLLGPATSGNKIRLWRLAPGRELRVLRCRNAGSLETINSPVVHADGRTLAACGPHWLSFFDLASGEELASVRQPQVAAVNPVFFDPPHPSPSPEGGGKGEGSGGWMTGGYSGLCLWPARPDPARPEVLCVGPPQQLAPGLESGFSVGASASADGRVVAVPQGSSTLVLHRDRPDRRVVLGGQSDVRFSAVSPDGSWVVTCSHWWDGRSKSVRIWDAGTGQQVHELPMEGSTQVRFSPDGRWLMTVTDGAGSRLWEAGTWREMRRLDGGGCFSPDSRLLAISDIFSVIRLVETATGKEVARLTGPEPMWYHPAYFTPDGTRLIAICSGGTALYVWDLRLIRQQLKELGLDWEWDEFPPAGKSENAGPAPVVRVVGAESLFTWTTWLDEAKAHAQVKQWDEATAAYSKAIELKPEDGQAWCGRGSAFAGLGRWDKAAADFEKATQLTADDALTRYFLALLRLHLGDRDGYRKVCSGMLERFGQSADVNVARWTSWTCVLSPSAEADWGLVIRLAENNLAADPKNCDKLQNLGAVFYRAGRFEEADQRLTEAEAAFHEAKNPTSSSRYNWLFQAMTQHRLGHTEEARRWLEKAVNDIDQPPPERPQDEKASAWNRRLTLQLLRREAEELLKK
jgi:serine/threonine protein kinase/WD40 repeat protein/tetratricopeptide (TPR) repeat protein